MRVIYKPPTTHLWHPQYKSESFEIKMRGTVFFLAFIALSNAKSNQTPDERIVPR